jgi:hypothetical protein
MKAAPCLHPNFHPRFVPTDRFGAFGASKSFSFVWTKKESDTNFSKDHQPLEK